jgi:hypothetical protein
LVITAYVVGLPYGPKGVAFAYSLAMVLWIVPHVVWCIHGTVISFMDVVRAVSKPVLSAATAAALVIAFQFLCGRLLAPLPQLLSGGTILFGVYLWMLLFVMGQKTFYMDLIRGLRNRSSATDEALAPA